VSISVTGVEGETGESVFCDAPVSVKGGVGVLFLSTCAAVVVVLLELTVEGGKTIPKPETARRGGGGILLGRCGSSIGLLLKKDGEDLPEEGLPVGEIGEEAKGCEAGS